VEGDQQELLGKYVEAFEAYDMGSLVTLLSDDARFTMPPFPLWVVGPDDIAAFMLGTGAHCRGSRVLTTSANGGPAFGIYHPDGDGAYSPWALVVMETSAEGRIVGLHHFIYPELFPQFGLPSRLEAEDAAQPHQLQ
jgi:RNA polymerase sigma-70 factor (ECF subfamily)